ncbi:MAG: AzlC family ABC transporter permease [Erysipelotrichaceae bacterium]|nr:AzlC family ABC transporter permease [Erysipelotrichaceae bacterium]
MKNTLYKEAFKRTLPVLSGYIVLGMGYGILMAKNNFDLVWTLSYGLLTYAGSMQFVAINLMKSSAHLLTVFITTLMVNLRHFLYGLSMVDHYKDAGRYKPYLIFGLTDETYSLVVTWDSPEGVDPYKFAFVMTLFNQIYWVTGGIIGAILGSALTFNTAGIDFAMTALFITVAVEQWCATKNHLPALLGLLGTVICLALFGGSQFLIPAMVLMVSALTLLRPYVDSKDEEGEQHA